MSSFTILYTVNVPPQECSKIQLVAHEKMNCADVMLMLHHQMSASGLAIEEFIVLVKSFWTAHQAERRE